MAIVKWPKTLYSLDVKQKFGDSKKNPINSQTYPARKAQIPMAGIYQIKHTKKGREISVMPISRPTNPRTEKQQAWRAIFAAGVLEWQALDSDSKQFYNILAAKIHLEGFNLYMRKYLNQNKK